MVAGVLTEPDVKWESPDGGLWWFEPAHCPDPVSHLFADIIEHACEGWVTGSRQWGLPRGRAHWAHINSYLYYGQRGDGSPGDDELAARTRAERWWVAEAETWFGEERPTIVAENRRLQAVDVAALDLPALRAHARDALDHLLLVSPLHFSHRGRQVALARLREQAEAEGIDRNVIDAALAGGSPASSRPAEVVALIGDALREAGVDPGGLATLKEVRAVPAAGAILDEYLAEFGHRLLDSYDLACPTLGERPEVVIASIRATATPRRARPEVAVPEMSDELRQLLDEARVSYGIEDDDDGVCLFWPSGLLRRGLLELGRRLGLSDPADVFELRLDELRAVLDGAEVPPEIADRAALRAAAVAWTPPEQVGGEPATDEPAADEPAADGGDDSPEAVADGGGLRGEGVGSGVVRGRACVVRGMDDALDRIAPGDILIAVTTTPGYNAVMPIVAGVATEVNMGHTVICARELGIPAVVGVAGLLDAITDGATVEVDAAASTVRVIDIG